MAGSDQPKKGRMDVFDGGIWKVCCGSCEVVGQIELPLTKASLATRRIRASAALKANADWRYHRDHGWICPGCNREIDSGKRELPQKERQR